MLGGTNQKNNFSTEVDEDDKDFILNGCTEIMPEIKVSILLFDIDLS